MNKVKKGSVTNHKLEMKKEAKAKRIRRFKNKMT